MNRCGIAALLIAVLGLTSAIQAEARLAKDVVPTLQTIELDTDPDSTSYSGRVVISLDVRSPVSAIRLHADGQKLERIALTQGGKPVPVTETRGERGLLTLTAARALARGPARLEIAFTHAFNTQAVSLYRMVKDGRGYLFTQMEAEHAREAFPCFDEPGFKFPYRLTLRVPKDQQALFNTPIESETVKGTWKTIRFKRTPPLPSYLLAIAAGPLEFTPIPGISVPGRVVTVQRQSGQAAMAARCTAPLLKALEAYFGRPYPFEKLDLIAVPEYWFGAMENPGAITFLDNVLLLDPATATTAQRKNLYRVTAHELAHMWFGDWVTMAWWDDLWLNESFADWMGDKITDQVLPELKHQLDELENVQNIMTTDARPSTEPIRLDAKDGDQAMRNLGIAYNKGKCVLAMFEQWIGPEAFRRGVNRYLAAHAWKNATAADLWQALGEASGKNVTGALAGYIEQQGHPLVTLEKLPHGALRLTQRRYLAHGVEASPLSWRVPMSIRYSDGDSIRTEKFLLDRPSATLQLPGGRDPVWVMPNGGGLGYYRWNVPRDMLLALARQGARAMTPAERIAFLGNLGALLTAGELHGDEYLEALAGMADDPEPLVVRAVAAGLWSAREAFVGDALRDGFAAYVRQTLRPVATRFGLEKKAGEPEAVSLVRPVYFTWLGRYGRDPAVLGMADQLAESYMRDSSSIDPTLASSALRLHALRGDRSLFERYRHAFESAQSPTARARYLTALSSFEDDSIQAEALRYVMRGPLRPNELLDIPFGIGGLSDAAADRVLGWMFANYGFVQSKVPRAFLPRTVYMASGCSEERLARVRAFFSDSTHVVAGTEKRLEQVGEQVEDCAGLRRREGAAVAAYLTRLGAGP
ncbi:MAG: M1 family aminopeptidase [Candidatus Eiseniibacteriota bacterium]